MFNRGHHLDKVYRHVPVWAQNLGISLYGLSYRRERLGGVFTSSVKDFRTRDRWTRERMDAFLQQRLRSVLQQAFHEIPYYSQRWQAIGLNAKAIERFSIPDLSTFPLPPNGTLWGMRRCLWLRMRPEKKNLHQYYSSGAQAHPSRLFFPRRTISEFLPRAKSDHLDGQARASFPRVMIGGRLVVPTADAGPPYYRITGLNDRSIFRPFTSAPVECATTWKDLTATGLRCSQGTPTRITPSPESTLSQGMRLDYAPAALALSSKLTPEMKRVIHSAFRVLMRNTVRSSNVS